MILINRKSKINFANQPQDFAVTEIRLLDVEGILLVSLTNAAKWKLPSKEATEALL